MSTLTAPQNVHNVLTQTLGECVESQVVEQGLADESEYFGKLAEEERQRRITAYYEYEIQKGLESGAPIPVTPEFWNELNAEIEQVYLENRRKESR